MDRVNEAATERAAAALPRIYVDTLTIEDPNERAYQIVKLLRMAKRGVS